MSLSKMSFSNRYILIRYSTYCSLINLCLGLPLIGNNVRDARENELPFVVSIMRKNKSIEDSQFCVGTLISHKSVLTAAHCLFEDNIDAVEINVGSVDLRLGKRYNVESWLSYDKYKYNNDDKDSLLRDIAIITLADNITDDNVVPATILPVKTKALYNTTVKIAGWGVSESDVQPMILKTALVNVMSNKDCEYRIRVATNSVMYIPDYEFCSYAVPWVLSSCGDSGGPILNLDNKLVGIHNGICPDPKKFDSSELILKQEQVNVHSNLYQYVDFIKALE